MRRLLGLLLVTSVVVGGVETGPRPDSVDADLTPAPITALAAKPQIWKPKPGLTWQIQYSGTSAATSAEVVDLDGGDTTKAQVSRLHAAGKRVVCYLNAGGYENWRPDRKRFPRSVIGKKLGGWPGERWLDIRKTKRLLPIMKARLNQCKAKGFDAVDPDNLDGFQNSSTGFPLKKKHALAYLKALSQAAHERGLAIGLKNATELVPKALPLVEFAVNEECVRYRECGAYAPVLRAGKAVFHVEYSGSVREICSRSPAGFSTVIKHRNLDAWARYC